MNAALKRNAVLDANAIIGLAKGECLGCVSKVFAAVRVPPLVAAEVLDPFARPALDRALGDWLQVATPSPAALDEAARLVRTAADREAVALALDLAPSYLLTSDDVLRRRAQRLGVPCTDVVSFLGILAEAGLVGPARPVLDRMRARGFGIHEPVYQALLRSLGE